MESNVPPLIRPVGIGRDVEHLSRSRLKVIISNSERGQDLRARRKILEPIGNSFCEIAGKIRSKNTTPGLGNAFDAAFDVVEDVTLI